MDARIQTAEVVYSTLSPLAITARILSEYDLGEVVSCEFLYRGLNDTFRIRARNVSYALRVYRAGWRSRSDIEWELDALIHLDRKQVPVAAPIANTRGEFLSPIDQPEGERWVVLFTYAEGQQGNDHTDEQARALSLAAAEVHLASEDFITRNQRFHLDLTHLIDRPLAVTLPFLERRPDDQHYLQDFAAKVRERITAVQEQLDFGFCHGDLHGYSAAFQPDGKVTMFDFDCGGPGWRAYDIAVYRWSTALRDQESKLEDFPRRLSDAQTITLHRFACSPSIRGGPLHLDPRIALRQCSDFREQLSQRFLLRLLAQIHPRMGRERVGAGMRLKNGPRHRDDGRAEKL